MAPAGQPNRRQPPAWWWGWCQMHGQHVAQLRDAGLSWNTIATQLDVPAMRVRMAEVLYRKWAERNG